MTSLLLLAGRIIVNYCMPVIFLVIRIQSVCRKAILICLNQIVAGVSNCDRCYHVYGGITFFEGSAPKIEVKKEALIF